MTINQIIVEISVYIPLVPVIMGIARYFKLSLAQKLLLLMIGLISLNQITSELTTNFYNNQNNLPFFHVYILIEGTFLYLIFAREIVDNRFKLIGSVLSIGLLVVWGYFFFRKDGMQQYPDVTRFMECLIVLFYSFYYFTSTFRRSKIVVLQNQLGFWLAAGCSLYFAGNSLLFLFSKFVNSLSPNTFLLIWTIHAVLTILLYIVYTIAIRCKTNPNLY